MTISEADGTPKAFRYNIEPKSKVKVQEGVPALITPVKPKYYFTSVTTAKIKASSAPEPGKVDSPNVDVFGDMDLDDQEGEEEAEEVEDEIED
eukprot:s2702_g15.t1